MSRRLPDYSPRDLSRAFERKLNIDFREGKHRPVGTGSEGESLFHVTLPKAHRNWSKPVQRDLLRTTRLSPDEFDDLVRCPMTGPQFAKRARALFEVG